MNTGLQDLRGRFAALGGIAENICQREGEYGRGIFPIDSSRRAKIMTPKNLLLMLQIYASMIKKLLLKITVVTPLKRLRF